MTTREIAEVLNTAVLKNRPVCIQKKNEMLKEIIEVNYWNNIRLGRNELGIILLSSSTLGTTVDAVTYYGNGIYCSTQKCWLDWSRARSEIVDRGVKAYVNVFTKVLGGR